MEIDARIAQTIVENIKDAVSHNINFFNTNGICIASTDPSRVGSKHEAALLAAKENRAIAVDDNHQYRGARNGINVPVIFNQEVVAVIGITGKRQEVEPFGTVLKKMTEILVMENYERLARYDRRLLMASLTTAIVQSPPDKALITYLAGNLNVDVQQDYICILGLCSTTGSRSLQDQAFQAIDLCLSQDFPHLHKQYFFTLAAQEFHLFLQYREEDTSSGAEELASALANRLKQALPPGDSRPVIGISQPFCGLDNFPIAYRQAEDAARWAQFKGQGNRLWYDQLDLGLVASHLSRREADRLISRVLGNLMPDRIKAAQRLFSEYTKNNGSIIHTADSLFLHKNTVQNQLNRLARLTGYNPRNLNDYAVLYLAFTLLQFRDSQGIETDISGPSSI